MRKIQESERPAIVKTRTGNPKSQGMNHVLGKQKPKFSMKPPVAKLPLSPYKSQGPIPSLALVGV